MKVWYCLNGFILLEIKKKNTLYSSSQMEMIDTWL